MKPVRIFRPAAAASIPAALAFALAFALVLSPAQAAIKCWTNDEGVRECGNSVPAKYAQQGHETLDKRGIKRGEQEAAKTIEELKSEREAQKAEELAALEEKKRDAEDRVLLDTFASEDDLILTRDGQIAHLESQIKLTRSHIDKLQLNLDKMIERAAEVERRGESPPKRLVRNIDSVRGQIEENEQFIATKKQEQLDITARFASDIERFRTLKSGGR